MGSNNESSRAVPESEELAVCRTPELPAPYVPAVLSVFDVAECGKLLADAFFNNPAHVYLYPDANTRYARLLWLMTANLGVQYDLGRSFAARDTNGKIAAMGFWHPPGSPDASLFLLARHGFLALPLRHGFWTFWYMMKLIEIVEGRRRACLNGRPSWFLNNMVVRPDCQGNGLGSAVLGRELATVVDTSLFPASLSTQKPENVKFYSRLGFKVVNDEPVCVGGRSFPNWIMIREPRNPRAA